MYADGRELLVFRTFSQSVSVPKRVFRHAETGCSEIAASGYFLLSFCLCPAAPWLRLWVSRREAPEGVVIRAAGTPTFFTIHRSLFTIHLTKMPARGASHPRGARRIRSAPSSLTAARQMPPPTARGYSKRRLASCSFSAARRQRRAILSEAKGFSDIAPSIMSHSEAAVTSCSDRYRSSPK